MRIRIVISLLLLAVVVPTATAEDILRICSAYYPGGCSLHIYDYRDGAHDFHALWCGGELIYEQGGLGGRIGSHGNCRYFA